MKNVESIVTTSPRKGADLSQPALHRLLRNTWGVCMTITEAAPNEVASVMHITNLDGRKTIVGKPTAIAKNKNTTAAIMR